MEKSTTIPEYFPLSPHCDHKYGVKEGIHPSHVSPEVPRTDSSMPTGADVKQELQKELKFDESTEETSEKTKSVKQDATNNATRKGRRKGRGKGKKAQTARTESAGSKTKTERKPVKEKAPKANKVLTDYFPVRRSYRMTSTELKRKQEKELEEAILSQRDDGLKVVEFEGKGRGVVATSPFHRGEFVVEYYGEQINLASAKGRESKYSKDTNIGCYMYYFEYKNKNYCVDATAESGKLGRLLNHSRSGNCKTQVVGIGERPYLILVAARDIKIGEELLYDYGDRNKETLAAHPWLLL